MCGAATLGAGLLITILVLAFNFRSTPGEEPMPDPLSGLSVWPTQAIRAFIIAFCITSVIWAYWTYRERLCDFLASHHFDMALLIKGDVPPFQPQVDANLRLWWQRILRWRQCLYAWHERWSITRWSRVTGPVEAAHLFIQYQQRGFFFARFRRVILFSLVYVVFAFSLMVSFDGLPQSPVRGKYSTSIDKTMLMLCVACLVFLVGYVVDLTRLTARLIRRLGDGQTIWPPQLLEKYSADTGLGPEMLSGYADVQFVARHTSHVQLAIYLPFIAISLMVISRSGFLDRWPWPAPLVMVFLFNTLFATACAWVIRREARSVREEALQNLAAAKLKYLGRPEADRLQMLIDEVKGNKMGAYVGWWHDPAIVGLLMPTGSVGAVSLIKAVLAG